MKVWIVFHVAGCCHDSEVKGVYATEAAAEQRVNEVQPEDDPLRTRFTWSEEHEVL